MYFSRSGFTDENALLSGITTLCVAFTLWLLARPYAGIWHDAIIYSLIAVHDLNPVGFSKDIFFSFGSQGELSLYGRLFLALVEIFEGDAANRIVVFCGGILWCCALLCMAWTVLGSGFAMRFCVIFCATLTLSYSPNFNTFTLNENFATARSLAMPLGLLGVALAVQRRWWIAGTLALVGMLLHPLLSIWPLLLIVSLRISDRVVALACSAAFLLIFIGGPFSGTEILEAMAPDWAWVVRRSSMDVFMGDNAALSIERIVFCLSALVVAGYCATQRFRRLYLLAALLVASGYLAALMASYFLHPLIIVQSQTWRVLWLGMVLGLLGTIDVLRRRAEQGREQRLEIAGMLLLVYSFSDYAVLLCVAYGAYLVSCDRSRRFDLSVKHLMFRFWRFRWLLVIWSLILLPAYFLDLKILGASVSPLSSTVDDYWWGFFVAGGYGLGTAFWAGLLLIRRFLVVLCVGALVGVPAAATQWDRRTPQLADLESAYISRQAVESSLMTLIRPGEVIYWPEMETETWFVLQTPFYAATTQAVGIVFSQAKTLEIKRRLERTAMAEIIASGGDFTSGERYLLEVYRSRLLAAGKDPENLHAYKIKNIDLAAAEYLCADPILDRVVFRPSLGEVFRASVKEVSHRGIRYWVLSCRG